MPEKKGKNGSPRMQIGSSFDSFIHSKQSRLEGGVEGVCASKIALRFLLQLSVELHLLLAES